MVPPSPLRRCRYAHSVLQQAMTTTLGALPSLTWPWVTAACWLGKKPAFQREEKTQPVALQKEQDRIESVAQYLASECGACHAGKEFHAALGGRLMSLEILHALLVCPAGDNILENQLRLCLCLPADKKMVEYTN